MKGFVLLVSNDRKAFLARLPLIEAARRAGYRVEAALPPGPPIPGLVTHDWALDRRGLGPLSQWRALRQLEAMYRQLQPDLVHHFTMKPVAFGGIAARRCGIPAVHSVTGLGYVFLGRRPVLRRVVEALLRRALRPARAVVFQNGDDRDLFVRRRLVDPERCVLIAGSGVDLEAFQPAPEPPGVPVVAFIGRLLSDKGVHDFVAAARILRSAGTPARLVLVGGPDAGNPASVTAGRVDEWEAEGAVEAWGWSDDMAATLASCHIACLPSYREGVPRALLEAAASGRPSIATDVPGCRDAVVDGVTGLLVPVRDPARLAEGIVKLAGDAALRSRMGNAARRLAEERFGADGVHARILDVYARALAAPRPPT